MSSRKTISKKIVLIGSFCVGKTSLVSSFVYKKFSSIYQTTIGVRIDKKLVSCNEIDVNMLIWDIGGELDNSKIPKSYYLGATGVIYVLDITRKYDIEAINKDIDFIKKELPASPIIVVGNKVDLVEKEKLKDTLVKIPIEIDFLTSAKTGENVENVFQLLANKMI